MRRRTENHVGHRQRTHLAHEAERRCKRRKLAHLERRADEVFPTPRRLAKAKAKRAMLEAIAEERKAAAEMRAKAMGLAA